MKTFEDALNEVAMEALHERFDYMRCQRKDGSYYGTGGQCRKGVRSDKDPNEGKKAKKDKKGPSKKELEQARKDVETYDKRTNEFDLRASDEIYSRVEEVMDGRDIDNPALASMMKEQIEMAKEELGGDDDRDEIVSIATQETEYAIAGNGWAGQQDFYNLANNGASLADDMKKAEDGLVKLGVSKEAAERIVDDARMSDRAFNSILEEAGL